MAFLKKIKEERRRYIRISSCFPVEFFVIDHQGKRITPYLQGFTQDIGKGGICLVINDLWWGFWERFNQRDSQLFLKIDLPFNKTISATARVCWTKVKNRDDFNQYFCGVEFLKIDKRDSNMLFRYALFKKSLPYFSSTVILVSIYLSLFLSFRLRKSVEENRKLIKKYVNLVEKSSSLDKILNEQKRLASFLKNRQEELKEKIHSLEKEISFWKGNYEKLKQKDKSFPEKERLEEKIASLEKELAKLQKENLFLKEKIKEKEVFTTQVKKEFKAVEEEKYKFSSQVIQGLYQWIKNRQSPLSGLVLSYEGDRNLKEVCFTYDQALATIVFLLFNDYERAKKILDFYLKKVKNNQPIYNAYYINGGVFEYTIHSGPNIWIGIAALNYVKETHNTKYLYLAQKVAQFLFKMMDEEGGIKGGPQHNWYSTEHNLDAFAFFNLFYQLTKNKDYLKAKEKIENWIDKYAYFSYGVPVRRGKGDSTIATDTYAWSITSLGPKELFSLKMNPDKILEFAIENCLVKTTFKYKKRVVEVEGFDFAKFKNTPRGGVISCEWTAQMILAFQIMADFYQNKDNEKFKNYLEKSIFYFNQLQKMLITSFSKIGREDPSLPYASKANVDTGHGWRTPKGDRTGSLAATSYFLIAYFGYNPLKGDYLKISLKKWYEERSHHVTSKTN
jgi:TolA-binding protein